MACFLVMLPGLCKATPPPESQARSEGFGSSVMIATGSEKKRVDGAVVGCTGNGSGGVDIGECGAKLGTSGNESGVALPPTSKGMIDSLSQQNSSHRNDSGNSKPIEPALTVTEANRPFYEHDPTASVLYWSLTTLILLIGIIWSAVLDFRRLAPRR